MLISLCLVGKKRFQAYPVYGKSNFLSTMEYVCIGRHACVVDETFAESEVNAVAYR